MKKIIIMISPNNLIMEESILRLSHSFTDSDNAILIIDTSVNQKIYQFFNSNFQSQHMPLGTDDVINEEDTLHSYNSKLDAIFTNDLCKSLIYANNRRKYDYLIVNATELYSLDLYRCLIERFGNDKLAFVILSDGLDFVNSSVIQMANELKKYGINPIVSSIKCKMVKNFVPLADSIVIASDSDAEYNKLAEKIINNQNKKVELPLVDFDNVLDYQAKYKLDVLRNLIPKYKDNYQQMIEDLVDYYVQHAMPQDMRREIEIILKRQ